MHILLSKLFISPHSFNYDFASNLPIPLITLIYLFNDICCIGYIFVILEWNYHWHDPLTRYVNLQECRERFSTHWLQRKPLVSDPGIQFNVSPIDTCWCRYISANEHGHQHSDLTFVVGHYMDVSWIDLKYTIREWFSGNLLRCFDIDNK